MMTLINICLIEDKFRFISLLHDCLQTLLTHILKLHGKFNLNYNYNMCHNFNLQITTNLNHNFNLNFISNGKFCVLSSYNAIKTVQILLRSQKLLHR